MRRVSRTMLFFIALLLLFSAGVSSFADADLEYTISAYDVNVRINPDGSLDVTESVKYTSFGGYNNTVILIDKREGEEIEIEHVYMLQKEGYIECKMLSAGQWDANVFQGSYSVIQESNLVRVKVYGTFSKRYGSIIVQYKVNNAIKRYGDVAEYRRTHIQKLWEGRISDINITVKLPLYTETSKIRPFLHGVLVGRKRVESKRAVTFNVPDTVPGEYVEARIVFPEYVMYSTKITHPANYLDTILEEEQEYNESDKAELVKARENAAREAGRRAWNERMRQRTKSIAAVFSVMASLIGLYTLYLIHKKLRQLKKAPVPLDFRGMEMLRPSEVSLLMANGKTGARAFLASLLFLVSLGCLKLGSTTGGRNRKIFTFRMEHAKRTDSLPEAEKYILAWIAESMDEKLIFNPEDMLKKAGSKKGAYDLKLSYDKWNRLVLSDYAKKNQLETGIYFYRNLGLIMGAILFFLGCLIPVSLSIWLGYSMLPVGLILFLYVLRIGKHTDYTISHHRQWKELKKRILKRAVTLDALPEWMRGALALLGYSIVLKAETEPELVLAALNNANAGITDATNTTNATDGQLSDIIENDPLILEEHIRNTLALFDKALSSIQEI